MAKRAREELPSSQGELVDDPSLPSSPGSPSSRCKQPHVEPLIDMEPVMHCSLPPHREPLPFSSYHEYEAHYKQSHVNRCSECGKNFPSALFLTRHIEENHDPVIEARRERGEKTFGCFVEDCERRCSTPQKRRLHLIDKHCFPRTYNFYIVNDGIDRYNSLLKLGHSSHRRRVSLTTAPSNLSTSPESRSKWTKSIVPPNGIMERKPSLKPSQNDHAAPHLPPAMANSHPAAKVEPMNVDIGSLRTHSETKPTAVDDIADLARTMSALKFVPSSVTRRKEKMKGEQGKD